MTPPKIDPTNPQALLNDLFDDDRWIKDQFAGHLGEPILALCEALASCFRLMTSLNEAANRVETRRNALVGALVFGVLDDLVVSTKLLLTGKLPAAGNLMRQVVEGIAMSFLSSTDDLLTIARIRNQPPVTVRYWAKVWDEDSRTQGHRAVVQLEWNAAKPGVTAGAIDQLRRAKKHYNAFSHCGTATITNRVPLEEVGVFHLGGLFDEAKLDLYRAELDSRIARCRLLPEFIEHMTATMTRPPADPRAPALRAEPA
jgi:hypothetical protein